MSTRLMYTRIEGSEHELRELQRQRESHYLPDTLNESCEERFSKKINTSNRCRRRTYKKSLGNTPCSGSTPVAAKMLLLKPSPIALTKSIAVYPTGVSRSHTEFNKRILVRMLGEFMIEFAICGKTKSGRTEV